MRLAGATPLDCDQRHTVFDRELPPALTIEPGARLRVETVDCFSNTIRAADQRFDDNDTMLRTTGDLNPVTGPIHVLGAAPGDLLAVEIEEIRLAADQPLVTILIPGLGGPTGRSEVLGALPADTRLCSLHDGRIEFPTSRGPLSLPVRPMVGSIGTAPAGAPFPSLESRASCGGNMDCPDVTTGATLLLPVEVEGGLVSLGDVHAAMGDAEITATAIEASAAVSIRVGVLSDARDEPVPRLLTPAGVGSIGCAFGATLEENLERAFADLVDWCTQRIGLSRVESYELAGIAARVRINQCVPGGWRSVHAWLPWISLPNGAEAAFRAAPESVTAS